MRLVSVGLSCNNSCAFCAQGDLRRTEPARDLRAAVDAVEAGDEVAFVGGEPTLADDLPAWVAECDRRGAARIVVQTNGRRLSYRAWAERLGRSSSKLEIEVSVQGSTAPMHDYHTRVPGSFAQTLRGLAVSRALGIRRRITTVVTRSSFRHLVDLVRLAHSLGAREMLLSNVAPVGHARRAFDRLVPAPEMVEPFFRAAQAEAGRLGLALLSAPAPPFVGIGEVEPDDAPSASARVADGRVRLALVGRPQPALREVHGNDRRTGEALREILPALFDGERNG